MSSVVTRRIPWEPSPALKQVGGGALGRHVEHDPRSRAFPYQPPRVVKLRKLLHGTIGGILNQGNIGACTGFATAKACNSRPIWDKAAGDKILTNDDGLDLYHRATIADGFPGEWPPDDTGSSGLAACKGARDRGLITSYRWALNLDDALQALMRGCILVGSNWYDGFDNPDPSGLVEISGDIRGGHEYCGRGYDPTVSLQPSEALVWFDNSWTIYYGLRGRFCMTVGTLEQLLAESGDVAVPWE